MSTDWKQRHGLSTNRNVKLEILEYESGKWKDVYNSNGKKNIVFDISGKNCGIGVGTQEPFSRISLGNNTGDGTNTNLAALGIHELSNESIH